MKNLFLSAAQKTAVLAVLLFLLVAPFQPLVAQAAGPVSCGTPGADPATCIPSGDSTLPATAAATSATPPSASPSNPNSGGPNGTGTPIECSWTANWGLCITNVVYVFTVGIGSGFAYIAAYFFDWAIALSLNGGIYALTFVSQGWTTARDIANMAFLFILLYIAFKVIFEAETNETIHMLTMVIVVALLVNFSFFLTRLAIDAGNILSIQFYNAIQAPSIATTAASQASGVSGALGNAANASAFANSIGSGGNSKDLTASIMNMLNFQGLFGSDSFKNWYQPQQGPAPGFMVVVISLSFLYIAAGIMFWLLTVAFVTNGIKFLFRIVILWFLIIAAPLAFVARAVPKFETYYHQWQEALIKHAFYPAAFMFIFLILTQFATQLSCTNANVCGQNSLVGGLFGGLSAANAASPVAAIGIAAANIFIRLGFVIAMLYIGMEAAKKVGVMGASAAEHAGNWVGGRMIGAYGAAGRNTAGWAAYRTANAGWARKLESKTGLLGLTGRGIRGTLGTVGRASFDARGIPGAGAVLKDAGKAQKGGFESAVKETVEAKEKKLKAVEPSEAQKAQARAAAEKETGYAGQSTRYNEAKTKRDSANARLQALIEGGKENTPDAAALKIEVSTHKGSMDAATGRMKALEDITQQKAKEISGEDLSKKYADVLSTPNIRNLWIPFRSSKEAGAKIKKGKTPAEKILEEVQKANKNAQKEEGTEAPAKEGGEH